MGLNMGSTVLWVCLQEAQKKPESISSRMGLGGPSKLAFVSPHRLLVGQRAYGWIAHHRHRRHHHQKLLLGAACLRVPRPFWLTGPAEP